MPNAFVHVELQSQTLSASKEFYGQLFNWELEEMPIGDGNEKYIIIRVGNGTGGGMMQHPVNGAPSCWVPYIDVENLQQSTAKAKQLGAQILRENCIVPDMGSFSIIQDPQGVITGLWQNK